MKINFLGRQAEIGAKTAVAAAAVFVVFVTVAAYTVIKGDDEIIIDTKPAAGSSVGQPAAGGSAGQPAAVSADGKSLPAGSSAGSASGTAMQGLQNTGRVTESSAGPGEIKVYVTGCVKKRGIVTLQKGQLIDDAIRLAGGPTEEADLDNVNLVYELRENVMLYIKSKKETEPVNNTGTESSAAGKGVKVIKNSGGAVVGGSSGDAADSGKININTANREELDTLPGIGEATAQEIISYREKNGPFSTVQDIMKVPRIKESRFSAIEEFITVE